MKCTDKGITGNKDVAPLYEREDVKIKAAAARPVAAAGEVPVLTATRIEKLPKSRQTVTRTISAHGMQALQDIAKQYFESHKAPWVVSNGERFFS